jgi:hypothetical protein
MNNMEVLIPIAVFASIISIVGCHRLVSRGEKPTVAVAILAAFGSVAIYVTFGFIAILASTGPQIVFSINYWMGDAKPGLLAVIFPVIAFSIHVSTIPASVVVFFYQRNIAAR